MNHMDVHKYKMSREFLFSVRLVLMRQSQHRKYSTSLISIIVHRLISRYLLLMGNVYLSDKV